MTLRVVSIFGTRPEAVKMAPVVRALAAEPQVEARVVVTAQHRQMLDQVLGLFGITPDVDLDLMRPNQSLAQLTAEIITHLDPVLQQLKPDWILVQGDTTTVMAAALLGFYNHIRVGHVEAGLRTGDKWQPFPEEINRRIAGVTADLHFAPTEHSRRNLLAEGVPDWRIVVTGNPAIDALNEIVAAPPPPETQKLLDEYQIRPGGRKLVLITAHRRENFGEPLENICLALQRLAVRYPSRQFVYPVHLNPNVQNVVHNLLNGSGEFHPAAAAGLPADDQPDEACRPGADRFGRHPGGSHQPAHPDPGAARGDRAPGGCGSRCAEAGWYG